MIKVMKGVPLKGAGKKSEPMLKGIALHVSTPDDKNQIMASRGGNKLRKDPRFKEINGWSTNGTATGLVTVRDSFRVVDNEKTSLF